MAVKVLRDPGGQMVERFVREAEVLGWIKHPAVVRYISHGKSTSGDVFMVMEWLQGETLSSRINRTGLTIEESILMGRTLADALAIAHDKGIIHRDIKPSNVFLQDSDLDRPKLLDFGIARLAMANRLTGTGMMLGTPGYMAPEQARGLSKIRRAGRRLLPGLRESSSAWWVRRRS